MNIALQMDLRAAGAEIRDNPERPGGEVFKNRCFLFSVADELDRLQGELAKRDNAIKALMEQKP